MTIDEGLYAGREPAFVKHTFLQEYLPALFQKVAFRYDQLVYIDGFSGPWKSRDEKAFKDTSFGIALDALRATVSFQKSKGRKVSAKAILVEKSQEAFADLQTLVAKFPDINIVPINGEFEANLERIVELLPDDAFQFLLIDPKGMKLDLRKVGCLLGRPNSEVLINFMYDFISRFVDHPDEQITANHRRLLPHVDWELLSAQLANCTMSTERESLIVGAFQDSVRREGAYTFVPSLTVQKAHADRTLYHLVFGTRKSSGLKVFRDSQTKALNAQAKVRTQAKEARRVEKTGQPGLFSGDAWVGSDFSIKQIEQGNANAATILINKLPNGPEFVLWKDLWPEILGSCLVSYSSLGRIVNDLRKSGVIGAPDWPSPKKIIPDDDQKLCLGAGQLL
ncbi:three-Cys-motif partner protein TcmP [Sphingomicrobium flavum]|uniref:three-Cys-motif partner protein TcmP n=1 Tax=Sphingomicrobium flavum TaxID=1229164 RepID=UPI0021AE0D20|nr:three-Cys-motif partner protein TcmP [Sphingomicrobium flavum]